MNRVKLYLVLSLCWVGVVSCSSTASEKQSALYFQLGEQAGLERLVDRFIQNIAKDQQIFPYFAKASVSHFRQGFITHICDISGGPCKYHGDNMVDIHTGMKITEADFNRVVELLVEAMEQENISYSIQNKLLAKLAVLRGQIIKL